MLKKRWWSHGEIINLYRKIPFRIPFRASHPRDFFFQDFSNEPLPIDGKRSPGMMALTCWFNPLLVGRPIFPSVPKGFVQDNQVLYIYYRLSLLIIHVPNVLPFFPMKIIAFWGIPNFQKASQHTTAQLLGSASPGTAPQRHWKWPNLGSCRFTTTRYYLSTKSIQNFWLLFWTNGLVTVHNITTYNHILSVFQDGKLGAQAAIVHKLEWLLAPSYNLKLSILNSKNKADYHCQPRNIAILCTNCWLHFFSRPSFVGSGGVQGAGKDTPLQEERTT